MLALIKPQQLETYLFAVYNIDLSALVNCSHISRLEPPIRIHCGLASLFVVVIANHVEGSANTDFSSGTRRGEFMALVVDEPGNR